MKLARAYIEDILAKYGDIVQRALAVADTPGFMANVSNDDLPRVEIEEDIVHVCWRTYESDYYGSGYNTTEETQFPLELLLLDDVEFNKWRSTAKAEEEERAARLRAAEAAVRRDRMEVHDRAEWARLRQKYGDGGNNA